MYSSNVTRRQSNNGIFQSGEEKSRSNAERSIKNSDRNKREYSLKDNQGNVKSITDNNKYKYQVKVIIGYIGEFILLYDVINSTPANFELKIADNDAISETNLTVPPLSASNNISQEKEEVNTK